MYEDMLSAEETERFRAVFAEVRRLQGLIRKWHEAPSAELLEAAEALAAEARAIREEQGRG